MRAQSCLTLCNPMDCSPPGSSVHGILLARILEWVAILSSTQSSQPRDRTLVSYISCISRQILYHWATWEAPCPGLGVTNLGVHLSQNLKLDSSEFSHWGNRFLRKGVVPLFPKESRACGTPRVHSCGCSGAYPPSPGTDLVKQFCLNQENLRACVLAQSWLSCVWLFVTLWTVAPHAPLSVL